MGFFGKLFGASTEELNNELYNRYGKREVRACYNNIKKTSRLKFKEVLNINDAIIEKYNKDNKADIQNQLLKKYLNLSQDDVNKQLIEEKQIKDEIDASLEGVDKKTKEQIKEDVLKDKRENNLQDSKDKKAELQSRIYKAMYNRMYDEYTAKVLQIKDAQFDAKDIGLTTKEAVEIIAYEKNLEKIELMYYNSCGKNFSQDKNIVKKREEFKSKFDYNQNGINNITDKRVQELNRLYLIREAKHRAYIEALTDGTKSPQEIELFKEEYEEANLNLVEKVPSLQEYVRELREHRKNEVIAQKAGVEEKSAINNEFDVEKETSEKVTESETAEYIDATMLKKQEREIQTLEYANAAQEDQMNKENYGRAKGIIDSKSKKNNYDESIEKEENAVDAKEYSDDQQEIEDNKFRDNLRSAVKNNMTYEEARKEVKEDLERKSYEENLEAKQKQEAYIRQRKNPNGNN